MKNILCTALLASSLGLVATSALALTAEQINNVTFIDRNRPADTGPDPFVVKAQDLLVAQLRRQTDLVDLELSADTII